jgi:hypothetical protein
MSVLLMTLTLVYFHGLLPAAYQEVKKRVRTTAGGATGSVRNLRIREDTAKYLLNLDVNSAYYDPKTRYAAVMFFLLLWKQSKALLLHSLWYQRRGI